MTLHSDIKLSLQFLDDIRASCPGCDLGLRELILLFVTVPSLNQNPVQRVALPREKEIFLL